jgi:hypothetical protein
VVCFVCICAVFCFVCIRAVFCVPNVASFYKIRICCFSAKHAAIRIKSKYWLARNQDNVSVIRIMCQNGIMSIRGLYFSELAL